MKNLWLETSRWPWSWSWVDDEGEKTSHKILNVKTCDLFSNISTGHVEIIKDEMMLLILYGWFMELGDRWKGWRRAFFWAFDNFSKKSKRLFLWKSNFSLSTLKVLWQKLWKDPSKKLFNIVKQIIQESFKKLLKSSLNCFRKFIKKLRKSCKLPNHLIILLESAADKWIVE